MFYLCELFGFFDLPTMCKGLIRLHLPNPPVSAPLSTALLRPPQVTSALKREPFGGHTASVAEEPRSAAGGGRCYVMFL